MVSGVQQRIREHCPNAPYVHCKSHILNFDETESCNNIRQVRNLLATVDGVDCEDDIDVSLTASEKGR